MQHDGLPHWGMWVCGSAFCEVRATDIAEARQRIEERMGPWLHRQRVLEAWRDDGRPVRRMGARGEIEREEE